MLSFSEQLSRLEEVGNRRMLRDTRTDGRYIHHQGRRYINLSSNDYLGVASNPCLQAEFLQMLAGEQEFLFGATSSRLLTGNAPSYSLLEKHLANMFGREAALVFNSGYHANIGILAAISGKGDLILADRYVHASIIDGLRLCEAKWERFRHNDLAHLEKLIVRYRADFRRIFIVTESVFSMDGDLADLTGLCDLKERYGAILYVDEAHAVGALGAGGLGLAEVTDTVSRIDLIVGTFGKAIASQGAYVIASRELVDFLINMQRSLIFTTAQPSINIRWTDFVLQHVMLMNEDRVKLAQLSSLLRSELALNGLETRGDSHIVPVVVGENEAAISLAQALQDGGYWVLPIRYPTVPRGEARIRISLNPQIAEDEVHQIVKIAALWKQNG